MLFRNNVIANLNEALYVCVTLNHHAFIQNFGCAVDPRFGRLQTMAAHEENVICINCFLCFSERYFYIRRMCTTGYAKMVEVLLTNRFV